MGRLIVSAHVTVDGVMDRLGTGSIPRVRPECALELLKRQGYGRAGASAC